MNLLAALKYPMVTKQVQEFLVVSFPDLEITVSEQLSIVDANTDFSKHYLTLLTKLQIRAIHKALEKLSRLNEVKKTHYRPPSYIRQTIQLENKDSISTKKAAEFLKISERTLRRWEDEGYIHASKTKGGHRTFNLGELERVKSLMEKDENSSTPVSL